MRRTILSSVLIIGAALAVVFAGGTFSAFTDTEEISGTATAAIVDFELNGDGANTGGTTEGTSTDTLTIDFDGVDDTCPSGGASAFFAPGDTCTIEVNLSRDNILQQLAVLLSVSAFSVNGVADNSAGDLDSPDNTTGTIALDCDSGAAGGDVDGDWIISYLFQDPENATFMPAGLNDPDQQIHITVTLESGAVGGAGEAAGCQGDAVGTIALTISATQAANPHDNTTETN